MVGPDMKGWYGRWWVSGRTRYEGLVWEVVGE